MRALTVLVFSLMSGIIVGKASASPQPKEPHWRGLKVVERRGGGALDVVVSSNEDLLLLAKSSGGEPFTGGVVITGLISPGALEIDLRNIQPTVMHVAYDGNPTLRADELVGISANVETLTLAGNISEASQLINSIGTLKHLEVLEIEDATVNLEDHSKNIISLSLQDKDIEGLAIRGKHEHLRSLIIGGGVLSISVDANSMPGLKLASFRHATRLGSIDADIFSGNALEVVSIIDTPISELPDLSSAYGSLRAVSLKHTEIMHFGPEFGELVDEVGVSFKLKQGSDFHFDKSLCGTKAMYAALDFGVVCLAK